MKRFAFFLPQFHEIPENNKWWGNGFTEWVNVKNAKPLFRGHKQPQQPIGGYYDLLQKETMINQTKLLDEYEIDGMAYYHYYFCGKKLLEKPAENLLKWKDINQKFFFCWANHSWIKSVNGKKSVLIEQKYGSEKEWEEHFQYLLQFFNDPRYEKRNNKPLLMLFKPDFKEKNDMMSFFDKKCKENGFDGIFVINTCSNMVEYDKFTKKDRSCPYEQCYFFREPSCSQNMSKTFFNKAKRKICSEFSKRILRKKKIPVYDGDKLLKKTIRKTVRNKNTFHGIFFEWDNTPRHKSNGYVIKPISKKIFSKYYDSIKNEEYTFINAWNEWAEGMVLEGTKEKEYRYLEWLKDVKKTKSEKKSVKQNYIFNTIYQVLSMMIPFFTIPYVSRVLGADGVGAYSYVVSIVSCFSLVGAMGVKLYGQREVAYVQENIKQRSEKFWGIFALRTLTSIASFFTFFLMFILRENEYSTLYWILSLELFTNIFDISWFFQGMEEFKRITIRNGIIKILSIIPVFVFVKTSGDLVPYVLIHAISNLISSISLWPFLPKYVEKVRLKYLHIWSHFKPMFLLFLPQAAAQVYTVLDTTMLGTLITDKTEVGYYEQSQKTIHLLLTIVISLSTVMMPKIANSISKKSDKIEIYMKKSFEAIFMLALPIVFGVIACSNSFVPLFFGDGYDKTAILLRITSVVLLFVGLASIVGIQYLIPAKRQNQYTFSVVVAAVINLIFNSIFIPILGAIGAAIGTVIAEGIGLAIQLFVIRKDFNLKKMLGTFAKYFISSIIMFISCELIRLIGLSPAIEIASQALVGTVVYLLCLYLLKANLFLDVSNSLFKRVKKILFRK